MRKNRLLVRLLTGVLVLLALVVVFVFTARTVSLPESASTADLVLVSHLGEEGAAAPEAPVDKEAAVAPDPPPEVPSSRDPRKELELSAIADSDEDGLDQMFGPASRVIKGERFYYMEGVSAAYVEGKVRGISVWRSSSLSEQFLSSIFGFGHRFHGFAGTVDGDLGIHSTKEDFERVWGPPDQTHRDGGGDWWSWKEPPQRSVGFDRDGNVHQIFISFTVGFRSKKSAGS